MNNSFWRGETADLNTNGFGNISSSSQCDVFQYEVILTKNTDGIPDNVDCNDYGGNGYHDDDIIQGREETGGGGRDPKASGCDHEGRAGPSQDGYSPCHPYHTPTSPPPPPHHHDHHQLDMMIDDYQYFDLLKMVFRQWKGTRVKRARSRRSERRGRREARRVRRRRTRT